MLGTVKGHMRWAIVKTPLLSIDTINRDQHFSWDTKKKNRRDDWVVE